MSELKDLYENSGYIPYTRREDVNVESLKGKEFVDIYIDTQKRYIMFKLNTGEILWMDHTQDCCEDVCINDVCGDIADLLNSHIVHFEERTSEIKENKDDIQYEDHSGTWTFYDIQTLKGSVNIRWVGLSNGYYSESVDFYKINSIKKEDNK